MKVSKMVEKYVAPINVIGNYCKYNIVFMVDFERHDETHYMTDVEVMHKYLTSGLHCKFLKKESPVVNSKQEVILHYTSTTYKDWCNK